MGKPLVTILNEIDQLGTEAEKIEALQTHRSPALTTLFQYAFDARVEWLLPEGPIPDSLVLNWIKDTPSSTVLNRLILRKFYIFVKGGADKLRPIAREIRFLEMVRDLSIEEVKLVGCIKDRTLPQKTITPELVIKAYPDLDIVPIVPEQNEDTENGQDS